MSKTTPEAERVTGSRLWHGAAIIALVVLAASLAAGLLWFFADPLGLPPQLLGALDQRASVISMFTGMLLGVAGFLVAVMALRAQTRADRIPAGISPPKPAAAEQQAPQEGEDHRPVPALDGAGDDRAARPGDTDEPSTGTGKYVVDLRHAHGVQVGEHLTQHNVFGPPTDPA